MLYLFACTATPASSDLSGVPDGVLAPGDWGDEVYRLDVFDDGSAQMRGGCGHGETAEASVASGEVHWVLLWVSELAGVDTGIPPVERSLDGTVTDATMKVRLELDEGGIDLVLARGANSQIDTCQ